MYQCVFLALLVFHWAGHGVVQGVRVCPGSVTVLSTDVQTPCHAAAMRREVGAQLSLCSPFAVQT